MLELLHYLAVTNCSHVLWIVFWRPKMFSKVTIQIFCIFSDVTHTSNIILKEKNESGIVKVDYTANITHIETRLLRSCGLFLRAVIIWEEISFERIGTLTKFTVSPQFQTKALKEFVSIHDMKYVLSKNTPAMKVKLNSIVAWKSCQLEFEIPILCRSKKSL